jgi:hypothetical protein
MEAEPIKGRVSSPLPDSASGVLVLRCRRYAAHVQPDDVACAPAR